MALTKYLLGSLLERNTETNAQNTFGLSCVRGVTNAKTISKTKVDVSYRDLSKFLVVRPGGFVFNHRVHDKLGLGYNTTADTFIFTNDYVAFYVKPEISMTTLSPDYLYMWFLREEFDRYMLYKTYGSATLFFSWENMCELEIELPPISVQLKYVAIYKAMQANQQSYERGLEDLKLACEGYIDKLKACLPHERIGEYIALSEERNDEGKYTLDDVRGVSIEKRFIETKANMQGVNLKPYYVVRPDAFAFVTVTSRNGEKISLAHNSSNDTYICSSSYVVFTCTDKKKLLPRYLRLFFERSEFNRYARFHSWGSARETFDFSDMQDVRIPIPDIDVQTALADLFDAYLNRRTINEKLKAQLNAMCPILIRGSLSDGG